MSARHARAAAGVATFLGLALTTMPAAATDLARCAAIAAPDARLACYDQLAGRPAEAPGTPTTAAAAARPAPGSAATAAAAPPTPQEFGLSQAQAHPAPRGPDAIEARVERLATGGAGHPSVVLDNGQTWIVVDDDNPVVAAGDRVRIRRAALGTFLLTAPTKRTYRVRRTS